MGWKPKKPYFHRLAETTSQLLGPVLRKKTGLSVELIENWSILVGENMAQMTIPLKIIWARRASIEDEFQPATLVVGCEGYAAMILTHESTEVLQRINAFFGYVAINRIKVEQCVVKHDTITAHKQPPVDEMDRKVIFELTKQIENEGLRNSLSDLGLSIFAQKQSRHDKNFNN